MISSKYFSDVRALMLHPSRFFLKVHLKSLYNDGFAFAIRSIALFSFALGVLLVLMGPDRRTFFVAVVMVVGLIVSGVAELFVFSFSFLWELSFQSQLNWLHTFCRHLYLHYYTFRIFHISLILPQYYCIRFKIT